MFYVMSNKTDVIICLEDHVKWNESVGFNVDASAHTYEEAESISEKICEAPTA